MASNLDSNGHILDWKDANKYTCLLHLQGDLGFRPKGLPASVLRPIMSEAPIKFKFADCSLLTSLEGIGIPARGPLPFAANWLDIVEILRKAGAGGAARWIATLLYSEWSLIYAYFVAYQSGVVSDDIDQYKWDAIFDHIWGDDDRCRGARPIDLRYKWIIDDFVLRIRAVWDKIPHALVEGCNSSIKLNNLDTHSKRVQKLRNNLSEFSFDETIEHAMEKLVTQLEDIDEIKKHRDVEVHFQTKAYSEIFGIIGQHESIINVWRRLSVELNRSREAILVAIAIILLYWNKSVQLSNVGGE